MKGDISLPFNSNQLNIYIPMESIKRITITEDYSLQVNKSIDSLVEEAENKGFREVSRYLHPAVGLVVVMTNEPVLNV